MRRPASPSFLSCADQRDLIVSYASDDIEAFHKQDRQAYNVPAMYGNVWLREACKHQSLFVMRTLGLREWSERATLATSKNFSDGIITRESGPGEKMDPTAIILIKKGLKEGGRGGNPNLAVFGRG